MLHNVCPGMASWYAWMSQRELPVQVAPLHVCKAESVWAYVGEHNPSFNLNRQPVSQVPDGLQITLLALGDVGLGDFA